jgi:hypothetical protein
MQTPNAPFRKSLVATVTTTYEDPLGAKTSTNTFTKVMESDGLTVTTRVRKVSDQTTVGLTVEGALATLAGLLSEG